MTDNNQITVHFGKPSPEDLEAIWKGELPRERGEQAETQDKERK